jgi:DNA-binding beta-propeller fold protein YncE
LFIYGKNFGSDISKIKITIGGITAKVIGSNGECIYCVVPQRAYDGNIVVTVTEGEKSQSIDVAEKFSYVKQSMVNTLCGTVSETGQYTVTDGPFETAGFKYPTWLEFDPHDHNILYVMEDYAGVRVVDLENKTVSTLINIGQMNIARPRTICFSIDGNTMYISNDQWSEDGISNVALKRADNFLKAEVVSRSICNNGTAVHPVNGELYYTQYTNGTVWKHDVNKGEERKMLFKIFDNYYETGIIIHPTGNYAYCMGHNYHAIYKTVYNWEKKEFEFPMSFAGKRGYYGWLDGVGENARLNQPFQGVFVKNKEYEKAGKEDIYDFYFVDKNNHCVRKLTPEGMVTTLAGRGSEGLNSNAYGYVDGDLRKEARFYYPYGLTYDEETTTFYVADASNRRIRKITIEEDTSIVVENPEE